MDDLDSMAAMLGDPAVMEYYPAPKTREQAARWIEWNQDNYRTHGHGLWLVETLDGAFVGDCGLTWQPVDGTTRLEVGYHVCTHQQRQGFATEAARACVEFAVERLRVTDVVAIIHPDNVASRTVAHRLGMTVITMDHTEADLDRVVMGFAPECDEQD